MADVLASQVSQTQRQVAHWVAAATRLDLDELASPQAWGHLERYLGVSLRRHLEGVIARVVLQARSLSALERAARDPAALAELRRKLLEFQRLYLRTERTLDFFADAINCRTNPQVAAVLRACDTLAQRSMAQLLEPLGKTTPPAVTYLGEGRGASILRAHQRLWDGGDVCPVAAIKCTRHNLLRPTALIHEAGHQVAAIVGWNDELRAALEQRLRDDAGASPELAAIWASWASEIAADAFAFAHTGFASVAALHDVLDSHSASVFRYLAGDPHPISYVRVLLGVEMCRAFYGAGPWDAMAQAWSTTHRLDTAPAETRAMVQDSLGLLKAVVQIALRVPLRAFEGRTLAALVAPERVSPERLGELQARLGNALFTSAHWLWSEPVRILALIGLQVALKPRESEPVLEMQRQSMLRLGGALQTI